MRIKGKYYGGEQIFAWVMGTAVCVFMWSAIIFLCVIMWREML